MRRLLMSGLVATAVVVATTVTQPSQDGAALAGGPAREPGLEPGVAVPVADRALEVPAISVIKASVKRSKGTPPFPPSDVDELDIPGTALLAYQHAVLVIGRVDETCGLSWTLLAAIGRVESDHGRSGNARLRSDGTSTPVIRGVPLDGTGPVARIRDTDGGQLDGDAVWDRAVGPMQFLPSTWPVVGVDADADSVRSPDDLDDAALAAAVFLCAAPGDLTSRSGLRTALLRYNPSDPYVTSVLAVEKAYRASGFATSGPVLRFDPVEILAVAQLTGPGAPAGDDRRSRRDDTPTSRARAKTEPPGPPAPDGSEVGSPDPAGSNTDGGLDPAVTPAPGSAGTPTTDPPGDQDQTQTPTPTPTPDPPPSPEPEPEPEPGPILLVGVLTACEHGWCLDGLPVDVGDADFLATTSSADFSGDGVVGSYDDELTGLAGAEVSVAVAPDTAPALVLALNGLAYVV